MSSVWPAIALIPQEFSQEQVSIQRFLNLRYDGTDVPIMTLDPADGDYYAAFERAYQARRTLHDALMHSALACEACLGFPDGLLHLLAPV
jgi:hypothetical protein